jgi:hypothetical protein
MPLPSHPHWLHNSSYTWRTVLVIALLMQCTELITKLVLFPDISFTSYVILISCFFLNNSAVIKSSILWSITPRSPLKVNRRFGGTCSLHLRGWRWRCHVPPKRRLTFNSVHDVIPQRIELFITTGVRTSNPTTLLLPKYAWFASDNIVTLLWNSLHCSLPLNMVIRLLRNLTLEVAVSYYETPCIVLRLQT